MTGLEIWAVQWFEVVQALPGVLQAVFVAALGACIGSLINVLAYRLPRGLSVITPPSRCPACAARLIWRDNVPILGWLWLRGRCRHCREPISPEYPIVEALVALAFLAVYAVIHLAPEAWSIRPEWAANASPRTPVLPVTIVWWCLIACLTAITLIDAKTSTIPLLLAWIPGLLALVLLPAHAAWLTAAHGPLLPTDGAMWLFADGVPWIAERGFRWVIPTLGPDGWGPLGAAAGAWLGLGGSAALVRLGLLRRSFADYDEWEARALAEAQRAPQRPDHPDRGTDHNGSPTPEPDQREDKHSAMWIQYPHARREMVKELAFLAPPAGLAFAGAWLAARLGSGDLPLWLGVLGGALWGGLAGGGVCLGWIDPVLIFFSAAFLGLGWAVLGAVVGGGFRRTMPYGPFLAAATLLVMLGKPAFEALLRLLWGPLGPSGLP